LKKGHDVTMITSTSKYNDRIVYKSIDGINVVYIKEEYSQNMSVYRRLKSFFGFMFKSTRIALKQKDVDLVFATSTPLTVGFPALIMKWVKKKPYIFEVRDLWPEVPIQMDAMQNKLTQNIAISFEKTIYINANHVIALSPGMRDGVLKYIDKDKTSMIPNMSKIDQFYPRPKNEEFARKIGLSKKVFKIIHFGALGLANGADTIIESARLLKDDDTIEFVFLGGGSTEPKLKDLCKEYELTNVLFLGRYPMKETSEMVNICDVSIVSFKDIPILYTNSPNKLFDSLSAAKPIIVNSAGWTKELVEKENCGFYVDPNKPEQLVEKLKLLQKSPELVSEMSANSRRLAENIYDKDILCEEVIKAMETIFGLSDDALS
jgi:glycosyltransferase involved in cell wall biosynthesis